MTQVGYWANFAFPVYEPRTYITPGYQGTLGYGFPTRWVRRSRIRTVR